MIKRVERQDGVRYEVYGWADGRKVYVATFASRREAKDADEDHRTTQRKIRRGEIPREIDAKLTLTDAGARWIKALSGDPKRKGHRSHEDYEAVFDNHVKPTLGDLTVLELTRKRVIDWRDGLSRTSELSASTINQMLGVLSSACSYFVERGWLTSNPCTLLRRLEAPKAQFPWLQSSEAITRLLGECTPNIRDLVAVLVGTGLRLDEALHLRWDDVDLEHRLIAVHRGRKGTTKSGRMRHVPIFDSVLPVLRAMRLRRAGNLLLWPGGKPGRALSQPSVRAPFKRALDHAELPLTMRLHDLRHTFASLFLVDGGDIFKLSKILGHSSVAITEKTYAHLKPSAFEEDYGRVRFAMPALGEATALRAV